MPLGADSGRRGESAMGANLLPDPRFTPMQGTTDGAQVLTASPALPQLTFLRRCQAYTLLPCHATAPLALLRIAFICCIDHLRPPALWETRTLPIRGLLAQGRLYQPPVSPPSQQVEDVTSFKYVTRLRRFGDIFRLANTSVVTAANSRLPREPDASRALVNPKAAARVASHIASRICCIACVQRQRYGIRMLTGGVDYAVSDRGKNLHCLAQSVGVGVQRSIWGTRVGDAIKTMVWPVPGLQRACVVFTSQTSMGCLR